MGISSGEENSLGLSSREGRPEMLFLLASAIGLRKHCLIREKQLLPRPKIYINKRPPSLCAYFKLKEASYVFGFVVCQTIRGSASACMSAHLRAHACECVSDMGFFKIKHGCSLCVCVFICVWMCACACACRIFRLPLIETLGKWCLQCARRYNSTRNVA